MLSCFVRREGARGFIQSQFRQSCPPRFQRVARGGCQFRLPPTCIRKGPRKEQASTLARNMVRVEIPVLRSQFADLAFRGKCVERRGR